MSRKTATIILVIAIALVIGALVFLYFYFRRGAETEPTGEFPISPEVTLPETEPTILPEGETAPKVFKPILRQLTTTPVAGAVAGGRGKETLVRYIDRATGNVFEMPADGTEAKRLTNTTIPKVQEALWSKNGASVVLRYLKEDGETIDTYSASLKAGTGGTEGELRGSFFPVNALALALSPDGGFALYLRENEQGEGEVVRANLTGAGKTRVWTSPLREWLILWPKDDAAFLLSKPSRFSQGLLLSLNLRTGAEEILLRGIPGLTALPNHALTRILYSESSGNGLSLRLQDKKTGATRAIAETTLPEKCVWRKNDAAILCGVPETLQPATYPDVWYQGIISFTDEVWEFDGATGIPSRISTLTDQAGAELDVVKPILSPDERFLIFVNKKDGTLWSLQLTE